MLTGELNPSGRLPVSVARSAGQIAVYYNHPDGSAWHQGESIGFPRLRRCPAHPALPSSATDCPTPRSTTRTCALQRTRRRPATTVTVSARRHQHGRPAGHGGRAAVRPRQVRLGLPAGPGARRLPSGPPAAGADRQRPTSRLDRQPAGVPRCRHAVAGRGRGRRRLVGASSEDIRLQRPLSDRHGRTSTVARAASLATACTHAGPEVTDRCTRSSARARSGSTPRATASRRTADRSSPWTTARSSGTARTRSAPSPALVCGTGGCGPTARATSTTGRTWARSSRRSRTIRRHRCIRHRWPTGHTSCTAPRPAPTSAGSRS